MPSPPPGSRLLRPAAASRSAERVASATLQASLEVVRCVRKMAERGPRDFDSTPLQSFLKVKDLKVRPCLDVLVALLPRRARDPRWHLAADRSCQPSQPTKMGDRAAENDVARDASRG